MTQTRQDLHRQLRIIQARIDKLDSLPKEPCNQFGPHVIQFQISFPAANGYAHTKAYEYAAIKCQANGLWYTTGPSAPKAYTWEQLAEWMMFEGNIVSRIWLATIWTQVG